MAIKNDLTIIYYTSNHLEETNPYFLENTKKQLLKAAKGLPIISVSHKPCDIGKNYIFNTTERSHLNIYRQILFGCLAAKTKYVAMAEDDILYSESHFHSKQIDREFEGRGDLFLYDMNKVSLFTWTDPPLFTFRSKRRVVNQLIAPRKLLIDALSERFARLTELQSQGKTEEQIIKYWGDPGRYEHLLGVTERESVEFYSQSPSIVFSHEHAFGFLNHGTRKRLGDIKINELTDWGRAEDVLKLFYKTGEGFKE